VQCNQWQQMHSLMIPSVANPPDKDYQSLNVSFPVQIDGKEIDVGRMKGFTAFDDFQMKQPELVLFGTSTSDARHLTNFPLRYDSGDPDAEIDAELSRVVHRMNAMYFIGQEELIQWIGNVTGYRTEP
jgi:hypothetical protein